MKAITEPYPTRIYISQPSSIAHADQQTRQKVELMDNMMGDFYRTALIDHSPAIVRLLIGAFRAKPKGFVFDRLTVGWMRREFGELCKKHDLTIRGHGEQTPPAAATRSDSLFG